MIIETGIARDQIKIDAQAIVERLNEDQKSWFLTCSMTHNGQGHGRPAHFSLPDRTIRYHSPALDALTPLGLEIVKLLQSVTHN